MSWLTHAFRLGLALASISALGRRSRMVMVLDVTHDLYHTFLARATGFPQVMVGPAPAVMHGDLARDSSGLAGERVHGGRDQACFSGLLGLARELPMAKT